MPPTFLLTDLDQFVPLTRVYNFRIREWPASTNPAKGDHIELVATYDQAHGPRHITMDGPVTDTVVAVDSHDHGGLAAWLTELARDPDGPFLTLPDPCGRINR